MYTLSFFTFPTALRHSLPFPFLFFPPSFVGLCCPIAYAFLVARFPFLCFLYSLSLRARHLVSAVCLRSVGWWYGVRHMKECSNAPALEPACYSAPELLPHPSHLPKCTKRRLHPCGMLPAREEAYKRWFAFGAVLAGFPVLSHPWLLLLWQWLCFALLR